jgi:N-acetylmuramoyl-L-alanine amidase
MTTLAAMPVLFLLAGCTGPAVVDAPSSNQNGRVRYLVIHHTTENFAASLALLTEPSDNPVSAHYLIPEPGDDSYADTSLRVYRLVPESRRAWHAGQSYWNGEESLNDHSIGIELVNRTYCLESPDEGAADMEPEKLCFYPDFAEQQLAMLFDLVAGIVERHPDIRPTAIVGHADIAPDRKVDPGPRFPWQRLYQLGYGAWYDDETVVKYWNRFRRSLPPIGVVQRALHEYGYRIEPTGTADGQTRLAMQAFQMHFRPMMTSGEVDADSVAVLFALLEKYRPERLKSLLEQSPDGHDPDSSGPQDSNR